jgi:LysM repeat protein
LLPRPASADQQAGLVPLDDFSPALLGVYRKVMEIEPQIAELAQKYGVDRQLALAVCMYESGGNADLTSGAGAKGYFQVMPSTFRLMHVGTNIEAGVKYLSQLVNQFGREDYALAAYNGGPGRVARGRGLPLESLQYVLGVGNYRSVLRMYEPSIRAHAERLRLLTTTRGQTWWRLSRQLGIPVIQLKLHNPFLSDGRLASGTQLIAYPAEPRDDLVEVADDGTVRYRGRIGDNYFDLATAFDVDVDALRDANGLWRLQVLPIGMNVTIPLDVPATAVEHRVGADEDLASIALSLDTPPWEIIRANNLWDDEVEPGSMLRIPPRAGRPAPPAVLAEPVARASRAVEPARPAFRVYRVRRGDTLISLARRYGTSVSVIQRANGLGRRSSIRAGERLRIPR